MSDDGLRLFSNQVDGNKTNPNEANASGWLKLIGIATPADITAGVAGKLVDAAGLVKYMSDRFAILYPNGGTEENPANIKVGERFVIANPFKGKHLVTTAQVLYNGVWSEAPFEDAGSTKSYGARTSTFGDSVVIVSGVTSVLANSSFQGNAWNITASVLELPVRILVTAL